MMPLTITVIDYYTYKGLMYPRRTNPVDDVEEEVFVSLILTPSGDYLLAKIDSHGGYDFITDVESKHVGINYKKISVSYE
jgi:hypothetical protein